MTCQQIYGVVDPRDPRTRPKVDSMDIVASLAIVLVVSFVHTVGVLSLVPNAVEMHA